MHTARGDQPRPGSYPDWQLRRERQWSVNDCVQCQRHDNADQHSADDRQSRDAENSGSDHHPPRVTIDGASMYQVMSVNSGATLSIDDLTIAHDSSVSFGGGILNAGTLMASDCTFSGNS